MRNEKKQRLCGMFHHEPIKGWREEYGHIYFTLVWKDEDDKITNTCDTWDSPKYPLYMENLQINCQYDRNNMENGLITPYGQEVCYKPHMVGIKRAEKMVKTLKTINKRMDKYYQEWGNAQDFAGLVLRFLKAVGAEAILMKVSKGSDGFFYADSCYREYGLTYVSTLIRQHLGEVEEAIKAKAVA